MPNATQSPTPATMDPMTNPSDHPSVGISRMPKTRIARPPPIRTAPIQSSGRGTDSLDVEMVRVSRKSSAPAAANAQKMDCHSKK